MTAAQDARDALKELHALALASPGNTDKRTADRLAGTIFSELGPIAGNR
jgi:hypothetical protein